MGSTVVLPTKVVSASPVILFDASSMMQAGEVVTAAGVVATNFSGSDPSPGSIIMGVATVATNVISQQVTGGVAGNIYLLRVTINTNQSNTYLMLAKLAVTP
jgi:hypothetical protein